MKRIVQFAMVFLCMAPSCLSAQLTLIPNPVIIANVDITAGEVIAESKVKNGFDIAKDFVWTRKVTMLSEGWTTAVCDKNTCYLTTTETAEFNLAAGEENTMKVYIYPENKEGMAIVEVTVTDKSDETITATGTYYFNAQPSHATTLNIPRVNVYPNPSTGRFKVANVAALDRIEVFSITGQMISQFEAVENTVYNIENLPKGAYVLRMVDHAQQTVGTSLLQRL